MDVFINWIMVLGAVVAVIGFWGYTLEVMRGNIGRYTLWSSLNADQIIYAAMVLSGTAAFLGALIVGAILK